MTNLEKIVHKQLEEVFVGGYEWSFLAKVAKYGKCSPTRVDFDVLSLDGSYQFTIYVRASLLGLKFTCNYYKQWYSWFPDDGRYRHGTTEYYSLCGPKVSKSRKDFIKDNLKAVLLRES